MRYRRVFPFVILILASCGPTGAERRNSDAGYAQPSKVDAPNYTSSGFPKHSYPIKGCRKSLPLKAPFQVSEDGWGGADIRIPIAYLDDAEVQTLAEEGVSAHSRVSFAFPSRYRGFGMKEWFDLGVRSKIATSPRPLETGSAILASQASLQIDGTRGETRYLGTFNGRLVAVTCTATDLPNPFCTAEIEIVPEAQRYLAIFPPGAYGKLRRIMEVGDNLFLQVAAECRRERRKPRAFSS